MRSVTVIEIFIFQGERGGFVLRDTFWKSWGWAVSKGWRKDKYRTGEIYFFFFSFEVSKDNITALTYQHRNDQSIALLEILRPYCSIVHPHPLSSRYR